MKRSLSLFLVLFFLLSCAGCGKKEPPPSDGTQDAVTTQDGQTAPPEMKDDGLPSEDLSVQPPEEEEPPEDEPYVRVIDPSKPMVALTFDDGPDELYTDQILNTLVENHALATFFVVGQMVDAFPDVVKRLAEAGGEVGSHSYAHGSLTKLTPAELRSDSDRADAAIQEATGSAPYLIRPPYGSVNNTVSAMTGRPMICWNVDTEDWKSRDAQTVADYIKNYGDLDGDVVLFHSIYESTAQAIDMLVPWLQEQGYQLVTVTELMSYYYGEWPQPCTTYWNYFAVTPKTDSPLPLPGPGDLVAQPQEVPDAPAAPAAPTTTPAAPSQPTQPSQPASTAPQPDTSTPPQDTTPTPEEPAAPEEPEETAPPVEPEEPTIPDADPSGGETQEPGEDGGDSDLPDWLF